MKFHTLARNDIAPPSYPGEKKFSKNPLANIGRQSFKKWDSPPGVAGVQSIYKNTCQPPRDTPVKSRATMNASPFSGARERAERENSAPTGPPHSLSLSSLVPGEPWKRDDDDAARRFFLSPSSFHCSPLDGTPRKIEGEREFEAAEKKSVSFERGKARGVFPSRAKKRGHYAFVRWLVRRPFFRGKRFSLSPFLLPPRNLTLLSRWRLPMPVTLSHSSEISGADIARVDCAAPDREGGKRVKEREIASRGFIDNLILPQRSGRGLVFKSSTLFTRIISDFVTPRRRTPPYFSEMRYPS